ANATASTGNGCAATRSDGSLPSASRTPGPTSDSTLAPKSGAQCVSSARWDLRGGPPARAVPTAIMSNVRRQDVVEVAAAENQQSVEALTANAADPALRMRSRLRHPYRRFDDADAFGTENLVEVAGELAVAVTNEKP